MAVQKGKGRTRKEENNTIMEKFKVKDLITFDRPENVYKILNLKPFDVQIINGGFVYNNVYNHNFRLATNEEIADALARRLQK